MLIDTKKLKHECRDYGQAKIAQELGIKASTLTIKLKDPNNKFYVSEFSEVCQILGVDYSIFILPQGDLR